MAEVERGGGVRRRQRRKRLPKTEKRQHTEVSLFFQPWRDEYFSATKAESGRTGSDPRFVCCRESSNEACASETASCERARAARRPLPPHPPRTTRGSCPRRARTPPRLSKRIENVRGFLRRGEGTFETRVWDSVCVFSCSGDKAKKRRCAGVARAVCAPPPPQRRLCGGAEPAFAQALVPFDDDVVRLKERQVRALLVDLRDRLGEFGVVLRRWDAKRATMGTRRGRSVDAGETRRGGTRRARRGRGFAMTDAIEPDTRRRRVSGRDTTRRRLGRACRTCRRDVSEETMARRRARAHHGRGSRQTSRRVRSTVDAQTPRVGQCVRSRFAFAEETTSLRVRRRRCARARSSAASHPQTARAGVASDRSPRGSRRFRGDKNRETDFFEPDVRLDRPPAVTYY